MKPETLEKGNDLTKDLASLQKYLSEFEKYPEFYSCVYMNERGKGSKILHVDDPSQPEFLTMVAAEEFDYALKRIITATQKRIIELEIELENL
jgi:hypothetical protein